MNLDEMLDEAIRLDASDVHLVCGNQPLLRIARDLVPIEGSQVLTPEDMNEIYDTLVKGNIDKDEVFEVESVNPGQRKFKANVWMFGALRSIELFADQVERIDE